MRCLAGTLTALAVVVTGCGGSEADPPARGGPSVEELAGQWWVWASKRPDGEDPVTDRTGANCQVDQRRDVFFLAGTPGGPARRKCTIPSRRPIFFPVINLTCPVAAGGAAACREELRGAKRTVMLDGEPVVDRFVESPPYDLQPHENSMFAGTGGRSVAAGWHVKLDGLPPGRHRLRFSGSLPDGFSVLVDYRLTVR